MAASRQGHRAIGPAAQEPLGIPAGALGLASFRSWARSSRFPENGRVDFLAGRVEVDMSPEDLYTHGALKAEIAAELQLLVSHTGLGSVFIDRARISSPQAGLSVEPDIVVVLWPGRWSYRLEHRR